MRTLRKSLLMAAMAAALPFYMSDETAGAAPGEDPNAGASAADDSHESGTTQSATTATDESGTAGTAAAGDQGNAAPGADVSIGETASGAASTGNAPVLAEVPLDDATKAINQDTGKVEIAQGDHAEAKERFAGVLAKLHQFEDELVDEVRDELRALGTLLHLHSAASSSASTTGDYKPADLS